MNNKNIISYKPKNALSDFLSEGKRYSKNGYAFDIQAIRWNLSKDRSVVLDWVNQLNEKIREGARKTLAFYAEDYSGGHTLNISKCMSHFVHVTNTVEITSAALINYRDKLTSKNYWYLGVVRVFLKKWFDLGYLGVDKEIVELLTSWRIKGNEKGKAVLSIDPENGPFSDDELAAIYDKLVEAYANNKISINEYVIGLMIANTGRRPRQIGDLKVGDLYEAKSKDSISSYYINFPRSKLRGITWRSHFKPYAISSDLWIGLMLYVDKLVKRMESLLSRSISQEERNYLPLFPNLDIEQLAGEQNIILRLKTDEFHKTTNSIARSINSTIKSLGIISERTGEPLKVNPRRFRYTLGTRAAREGWGVSVIAELLDHSDTQNADVYVKNSPEHATEISKIMATALTPYAQAFAGTLVDSKKQAIRGNDMDSCIRMEEKALGNCGSYGFCSASAPIACYTCNKFQPWVDAPHESILEWLAEDRKRIQDLTSDATMVSVNDRTIIAVTQVIKLCKEGKALREDNNG